MNGSPQHDEIRLWLTRIRLHHLKLEDIAQTFVEFRPHLGHCRFSNCLHLVEPGCAVDEAAKSGAINSRRLGFYRALAQEKQRAPRIY